MQEDTRHLLSGFFSVLVFILWLGIFVEGSIPQLEILIFSGKILIKPSILKLFLIALLLIPFLGVTKKCFPKYFIGYWFVFVSYLAFNIFYLIVFKALSINYVLYATYSLFFFLIISPFCFSVKGFMSPALVERSLVFVGILLILIGLFQGVFNKPLLALYSSDGWYRIAAWDFYGRVRAFSLFTLSVSFGGFITFFLPFCLFAAIKYSGLVRFVFVAIFVTTLFALYFTYTRTVYLAAAASLATLFSFSINFTNRMRLVLVPLYALFGIAIAFLAPIVNKLLHHHGHVFSSDSMHQRYAEWKTIMLHWFHDGWSLLFGTGLLHLSHFGAANDIVSGNNNTYLAVGLYGGVVALLMYVALLTAMTAYLFRLANLDRSPLLVGIACSFSTWPITATFDLLTASYFMLFMLAVFVSRNDWQSLPDTPVALE